MPAPSGSNPAPAALKSFLAVKSEQVRERFMAYFEAREHRRVPSSPLVPGNDPTLLFTNAGMTQFKDVFLGFDKRDYRRAVTAQRCLRAGGKHNDLENVGYTARHHTFFEMLGNFSFGDYFKSDAIPYAWELLTSREHGFGLDRRHMWITVFGGGRLFGPDSPEVPADTAARKIWQSTLEQAGFSEAEAAARITDIPTSDNFWMMGETGPCGPCSEIFYNRNADADRFEGEDEDKADECVEVWNLVFMQFNRDAAGELHPLPAPCVDTGMGLERITAVLQGVASNYETDLLASLVARASHAVAGAGGDPQEGSAASLRVIADHIRAAAYLVADGVLPSNEGRGYVLRRIIRRALRHGHKLGTTQPFFFLLVKPLAELMGDAHPALLERLSSVEAALAREEAAFAKTLHAGMAILEKGIASDATSIAGDTAFELYDTYGFPLDLTQDYARERNLSVDVAGFDDCMKQQRARSRAATSFKADQQTLSYDGDATEFMRDAGQLQTRIVAAFADGAAVQHIGEGREALVVLESTPFYAEAGGQVGDTGELTGPGGRAAVLDTVKLRTDVHAHHIRVEAGELAVGEKVDAAIDASRRTAVCRAHSATHLLHAALHRVLGRHASQRGSLVAPDRLRFDFTHDAPVSEGQLAQIEDMINEHAIANAPVQVSEMDFDDAIKRGAMALFGEKYGRKVRVVTIDETYSVELCGGTHVPAAGSIGYVRVQSEEAVAAGVRRIEANCAQAAIGASRAAAQRLDGLAAIIKAPTAALEGKIAQLVEGNRQLKKSLAAVEQARAVEHARRLVAEAKEYGESIAIVGEVAGASPDGLRAVATEIGKMVRNRNGSSKKPQPYAAMLFGVSEGKLAQLAAVDPQLADASADAWLAATKETAGTSGGGSARLAQARGKDPVKLSAAVDAAKAWIEEALKQVA